MQTRVARIYEYGNPDVIKIETESIPSPGPGEVLIEQTACAIHLADSYMRQGRYFLKPPLPNVLGLEGIGTVISIVQPWLLDEPVLPASSVARE